MTKKFTIPMKREQQAQQIWNIVSSFVAHGCKGELGRTGIITYKEVVILMGYPVGAARTIDIPLGKIASYCLYHDLPLLNAMVVNKELGEPGDDVILRRNVSLEDEQKAVLDFGRQWFEIKTPKRSAINQAVKNRK